MRPTVNPELRDRLQGVSDKDPLNFDQAEAIAQLRQTHPHSIEFREQAPRLDGEIFNCFTYTLGLRERFRRLVIDGKRGYVQPDPPFIEELLDEDGFFRWVDDGDVRAGDVAIYLTDAGRPEHAAVAQDDLTVVNSKWGLTGHIWTHPVFELPSSYGVEARFIRSPDPDDLVRRLIENNQRRSGKHITIVGE